MLLIKISVFLLLVTLTKAYPGFMQSIPNGNKVPNPCAPNETWPGVGHKLTAGTGERNPFGLDFKANNLIWDVKFCSLDSDGDGRSNGEELGDPGCEWKVNGVPKNTTGLTHPGICEPMTSAECKKRNSWLNCPLPFSCPALDLPTTKNITLKIPRTAIPEKETTYICMGFKLPNETKYHAIGMKPLVDNSKMLHHMLLYGCNQPVSEDMMKGPKVCEMGVMNCNTLIGLWGPGTAGECHPDAFGFPIGQTGFQYALIQLHWNNAQKVANEFDGSGMSLFYTSALRPNDGMVVMTGQTNIIIPPQQPSLKFEGVCMRECTERIKPSPVFITAATLHMHLLGKAGKIELLRPQQQPQVLVTEDSYDYNQPRQIDFKEPIPFRAGDEFKVTCEYQSMSRNTTTVFGEGTQDEMCFGFLTMYPAVPNFDQCAQWMDLPQCSITGYDLSSRCDMTSFYVISDPASKICDKNCSKACLALLSGVASTGCLDGTVGIYIKKFWPMYNENMARLIPAAEYCKPKVSPTRNPNDVPGCESLTNDAASFILPLKYQCLVLIGVIFLSSILRK